MTSKGDKMKKYFVLLAILAMMMSFVGCSAPEEETAEETTVMFSIDFPDSSNNGDIEDGTVNVSETATIAEALQKFLEQEGLAIAIEDGESPFIIAIGDTEGGATTGWVYEVNGEMVYDSPFDITVTENYSYEWEFIDFAEDGNDDSEDEVEEGEPVG